MTDSRAIPQAAIGAQLDRILHSRGFAGSPRPCRFLRHLVEHMLSGDGGTIKEYSIGLEVFDRPPSFDPKADSIVRREARRLRARLAEYYEGPGREDPIVISVPKGAYLPEFRTVRKSKTRWTWPTAAALVLTATTMLAWRGTLPDPNPSVGVLDVRIASGRDTDAWMATALAEMLTENLSGEKKLRTIPTARVAEFVRDLKQSDIRKELNTRGSEFQNHLGAKYVVLADVQPTRGGVPAVEVDTIVRRLRDGQTVLRVSTTGSEAQLYALSARIASQVRRALGVQDAEVGQLSGPDRESMRWYAQAVIKLSEEDALGAQPLLEQSVHGDPSNFLARAALAETYLALGLEAQAKLEAQAALLLAPPLVPLERLALEARCQNAMHDMPAATASYLKLWHTSPEVIDYGLTAAHLQGQAQHLPEALRTISELRRQPLSLADEARIDFEEALLRGMSFEGQKGLALIRQCESKAQRLGARYLYARARLREGGLMLNVWWDGQLPPEPLDDALRLCHELGYRACEMHALRIEGNYFAYGRDPQRALETYKRGVEIARQLGNRGELVEMLNGMAFVTGHRMLDDEAEAYLRAAVAVNRDESGADKAHLEMSLAELLTAEGRLGDADRAMQEVNPDLKRGIAWNVVMADLERNRGEFGDAARRVQSVLAAAAKSDGPEDRMKTLREAFEIHVDQGDLRRAGAELREIEATSAKLPGIPYLRAQMALAQGNWEEALAQADRQSKQCRQRQDSECEAKACLVRVRALVGAGRAAEALQALDQAEFSLDHSRRVPLQIEARVLRLQAQTLLGSCPSGREFQTLADSARGLGLPWLLHEVADAAHKIRGRCGPAMYASRQNAR